MMQIGDSTTIVPITAFPAHGTYINRVLLSPDVRHLATCSADHNARIWAINDAALDAAQAANTQLAATLHEAEQAAAANTQHGKDKKHHHGRGDSNGYSGFMTSNIGKIPAAYQKEVEELKKKAALPLEATLGAHQRWVWDCAFSADSAYLVTASSDHYARLWELSSQSIIRQYNGHHRGAVCVALNDYSEAR